MTETLDSDPLDAFLGAVHDQDGVTARDILATSPSIAATSLHAAAALGRADDVRRLIAARPEAVRERAGPTPAEPLLYTCYSPWHGGSAAIDAGLLDSARLLLAAGADPNTKDARHGVPVLFAVTGMRSVIPLATLLLDAGANPTDGESVFHAAERHHVEALELLLARGADLNFVGDWGNTALWFLLRWWPFDQNEKVRLGFEWLLAHGADPNVRSGTARETALHVAARRGQPAATIESLLARGAAIDAERADGRTAWQLAMRGGHAEVAAALARGGATEKGLSAADRLLSACARGSIEEARRLSTPTLIAGLTEEELRLLSERAGANDEAAVRACLAAGYPIDTIDDMGATALHRAAIEGRTAIVRLLVGAGASTAIRDHEHDGTPLAWADFGARHVQTPGGDYPGTIAALG